MLAGRGIYILDGKTHEVHAGSTHSIRQAGDEDLQLLIMYKRDP
jgi:quercetin dioxygenase-like cupin family protein